MMLGFVLIACLTSVLGKRVTVFGASGGVGQLICKNLLSSQFQVRAVSRNIEKTSAYELLKGCEFMAGDARDASCLPVALKDTDYLVISVGTTAFPSSKWDNGNTPIEACVTTVRNILAAIPPRKVPEKIILLSSIGVERANQFPFKILNAYGVLDAKRESENLVLEYAKRTGCTAVIVRPGRLVGAPFTNFDLAKLLQLDQKANKGIQTAKLDVLAGDMERADVAEMVRRLITSKLASKSIVFSVINKPGAAPSDKEWMSILNGL